MNLVPGRVYRKTYPNLINVAEDLKKSITDKDPNAYRTATYLGKRYNPNKLSPNGKHILTGDACNEHTFQDLKTGETFVEDNIEIELGKWQPAGKVE